MLPSPSSKNVVSAYGILEIMTSMVEQVRIVGYRPAARRKHNSILIKSEMQNYQMR